VSAPGEGIPSGEPVELDVLDEATCLELLASVPVGRLGFVSRGAPVVLPVNHAVHDGCVVFRTAIGSKLDAAERDDRPKVVYEADAVEGDVEGGWSVVVHGRMEPVLDLIEQAKLERLGLRTWAEDPSRRRWLRIRPERITGRRITG
jgi:uncharacterized protein